MAKSETPKRDPFSPYVQELQGQEEDIRKKIEVIKEIAKTVPLTAEPRSRLEEAEGRLKDLEKQVLEKKIEDLEVELKDLEELIRNPETFTPPPPNQGTPPPPCWPPWWPWPPVWPPPPGGSSSSSSSSSRSGAVSADDKVPKSASTVSIGTAERDFIVARSADTVWVWHPAQLAWVAKLSAGSPILELTKVDGTIAVRTATDLWLFHPLEYRWLGPLTAPIEEVVAHTLSVPSVVRKES